MLPVATLCVPRRPPAATCPQHAAGTPLQPPAVMVSAGSGGATLLVCPAAAGQADAGVPVAAGGLLGGPGRSGSLPLPLPGSAAGQQQQQQLALAFNNLR